MIDALTIKQLMLILFAVKCVGWLVIVLMLMNIKGTLVRLLVESEIVYFLKNKKKAQ